MQQASKQLQPCTMNGQSLDFVRTGNKTLPISLTKKLCRLVFRGLQPEWFFWGGGGFLQKHISLWHRNHVEMTEIRTDCKVAVILWRMANQERHHFFFAVPWVRGSQCNDNDWHFANKFSQHKGREISRNSETQFSKERRKEIHYLSTHKDRQTSKYLTPDWCKLWVQKLDNSIQVHCWMAPVDLNWII